MKFKYSKNVNGTMTECAIDLNVIQQHIFVSRNEEDGGDVLFLFTTLDPVENYKQYQEINKKGEPTGWSWKKVTESPTIEVSDPQEIQAYMDWFNQQESI